MYIPKPVRYFTCHTFGHFAKACKGKEKCVKCGGTHNIENCIETIQKCSNCGGIHYANDKN